MSAPAPFPSNGWPMRQHSDFSQLGALIADPARARMLSALLQGEALTATELALEAGVSPSTASSHLTRLVSGGVIAVERQGRHRYFRLFDHEIATLLEQLHVIASRGSSMRRGPSDPALRIARVCYDHLAGERGVWLLDRLRAAKFLTGRDGCALSAEGEAFFIRMGIDVEELSNARRTFARTCLDWSERRHHLGGALGAAILDRIFALRWARRDRMSRAISFSPHGERALRQLFTR